MAGLTLDTGALIAFERRDRRFLALLKAASQDDLTVTVPTAALAEAYRGTNKRLLDRLLGACAIEVLTEAVARTAGKAQANVSGATTIDAIVAASAAQRGDRILTSDPDDMLRLREYFRAIRVVGL